MLEVLVWFPSRSPGVWSLEMAQVDLLPLPVLVVIGVQVPHRPALLADGIAKLPVISWIAML